MSALPVSVVVCTKERPLLCRSTLESILAGDVVPDELIVVDQSPGDATAREVRQVDGVTYLRYRRGGLSAARNHGARTAKHDVVAFCDDDLRVAVGWLAALSAAVADHTVATGRVERDPDDAGGVVTALVESRDAAVHSGRLDRDVLAGGNMAIRVALLANVGWFDERLGAGSRYPAAEDNDLGLRLLERGARIRYEPAALVYHRAWRRTVDYPGVRFRYGRGKGAFYAKSTRPGDRYGARRAGADLGLRARRQPRVLTRPVYALGELAYAIGVVAGAAEWLVRERR